jgi:hypothetical protein
MSLYVEVDYALTDRFSFSGGLPYVFAKYTDPNPPPPPIPYLPVDECHCWNTGWQDFGVTARYNLVGGKFALTPSVSFGAPSHNYDFRGEAVLGRHLKEFRLAIDAGQRLDVISPRLSVQGRYSYSFVERAIDIPNNRSNVSIKSTYLLTRKLAAQGSLYWQRTHGCALGPLRGLTWSFREKSTLRNAWISTIVFYGITTGSSAEAPPTPFHGWMCLARTQRLPAERTHIPEER